MLDPLPSSNQNISLDPDLTLPLRRSRILGRI